jgi:hypothetical protein
MVAYKSYRKRLSALAYYFVRILRFPHLDGDNPHAHVMLTMRELKIDEQGVVSFGNKDRTWNDKKLLAKQKLEWDGFANHCLKRAGFDVGVK